MSEKFLNSDRISELWSKTKEYVDSAVSGSGDTAVLVKSPIGTIVVWSGTADNIPTGWQLCDGTNGTPDLRDKFVLGAGENHAVGETGGTEEVTLTTAQMPTHVHGELGVSSDGFIRSQTYRAASAAYGGLYSPIATKSGDQNYALSTGTTGSSQPHPNMPPYFALCYIMKITADPADGVTQEELTAALAAKQNTLVNGTGTTIQGNAVNVTTPVNGIVTQEEFDALPQAQQNKGMYVVKEDGDGSGGGSSSAWEVYSTEEVRIGTWIDGMPLYRKVFTNCPYPQTSMVYENFVPGTKAEDLDIETLVKSEFFDVFPSGHTNFPYFALNGGGMCILDSSWSSLLGATIMLTKLNISSSSSISFSFNNLHLVLEYTKTTDQPEVTA